MDSDIRNVNEILARGLSGLVGARSVMGSTMGDTQIDPYGWRELGLFVSGSHGEQAVDVAVVGIGGNIVG